MTLEKYITEAISSGRRRHSKLDYLDMHISSDELIEILEELGYINVKSDRTLDELSLFDQGPDRYRVVKPNGGTRVNIKSSNALYDYMSVCFDGVGDKETLEIIYLFTIDTSGNSMSSRSDIKYLEKYITGKV